MTMTDQILTPVAKNLLDEHRALVRRERRGSWLSFLAGAGLMVVIFAGLYTVPVSAADDATQQKDQANSSKQVLANQATTVSDKTLQQCLFGDDQTRKTLTEAGVCAEAQQLRDYIAKAIPAPIPGATGQPGANGKPGEPGRGIASTSIVNGRFLVTYTDGATEDKGVIQGPKGDTGKGIVGTTVNTSGHLVLTYSDGSQADVGQVVGTNGKDGANGTNGANGKDGRGVSSIGLVNSRLVVTYTDGTTADLGPLPQGPKGNDGQPPMGWTGTTSTGKTYTCSRASNFDYSNPQYTCTAPTTPSSSSALPTP